jgi:uncharacterized membrane protein YgdD (TMEM256/DUF423 family)
MYQSVATSLKIIKWVPFSFLYGVLSFSWDLQKIKLRESQLFGSFSPCEW